MFKRTLCALLALLCVVGTLPVSAFATDEVPQTTEAATVIEEQLLETEPAVEETDPATEPTVEETAPVTEPVVEETTPVTEPVVEETAPVTEPVVEETAPVTEPVVEETTPVTEPVVEETTPATEPVVEETAPATEPVVEETTPATEPDVEETEPTEEETVPETEPVMIIEEESISGIASNTYYEYSQYLQQYGWYEYGMYESENNNTRGKADVLPVSTSKHIGVLNASVNSKTDANDYYKMNITETSFLKMVIINGHAKKHTVYRLYDSTGNVLQNIPQKDTLEYGNSEKDILYYTTYVLTPGTYYIGVYQPAKSGYASYGAGYEFCVHLYPRLDKPTVSVSNNSSTGKVVVSWNNVSDAQYYKVYRSTAKNGTYTAKATVYGQTWTDTSAAAGKLYYYKVQAFSDSSTYDESNNKSSMSAIKSRTCDLARPTVTVSNVESSGKIKLTWKAVSGAGSYKVYRSTSQNGTYSLMKTVTGTSYTNTSAKAGKTYYYKVKAIHKSNSNANSAYSTVVSGTCQLAKPVVTLSNVASSGKIKLSWKTVEGTNITYGVARYNSYTGEYELKAEVTGTSYTDTSVKAGERHSYFVIALDQATGFYSMSEEVSRVCDLPRPNVKITNVKNKPKLSWAAINGAVEYKIYRSTSKNGKYSLIKTTTSTSFTNTGAKSGVIYYYKVKAIHENTNANSAYSQVDSFYGISTGGGSTSGSGSGSGPNTPTAK